MTFHVEVWVLRQGRGDRVKVTQVEFVFVAIDDKGRPRPLSSCGTSLPPSPTKDEGASFDWAEPNQSYTDLIEVDGR
jgi:acyl-CoA hydrolase